MALQQDSVALRKSSLRQTCEGWLYKKGGKFKNIKYRFFSLGQDGVVRYYVDETKADQKGAIQLSDGYTLSLDGDMPMRIKGAASYPFSLVPDSLPTERRTYVFAATTNGDRHRWMDAMDSWNKSRIERETLRQQRIAAVMANIRSNNMKAFGLADKNFVDNNDNNLLHLAVEHANIETIKHILSLGVEVNHKNDIGQTPLLIAASKGRLDVVDALLGARAGVRINRGVANDKESVLHCAARSGNIDLVRLLMSKGAPADYCYIAKSNLPPIATWMHDDGSEVKTEIAELLRSYVKQY